MTAKTMSDITRNIAIVVTVSCIAAIGMYMMISTTPELPMNEVIFVPAYEECPASERVLLDMPIQIIDEDGNVVYHWIYECKDTAWNRTPTTPDCDKKRD